MSYKTCLIYAIILHAFLASVFCMHFLHIKNSPQKQQPILHTYLIHVSFTHDLSKTKHGLRKQSHKQEFNKSSQITKTNQQYSKLLIYLHNQIRAGIYQNSDLVNVLQNRIISVKFSIDKFGHIADVNLVKGTGLDAIDNMVITVVNNIGTVPQNLLPNSKQQFVINIVKN